MSDDRYLVAKKYRDELPRIKKNVEDGKKWWQHNYDSYWKWTEFVYETTLSGQWRSYLTKTKRPLLEFNIVEPFVKRQVGEFMNNEPAITVSSVEQKKSNLLLEQVIEGYLRHVFTEANKDGLQTEVFENMISKGFDVCKVFSDYKNNKTFKQDILWKRVFDPTLCIHDPLAKSRHKTDGRFQAELFPYTKEEVEQKYNIDLQDMKFSTNASCAGMSWSDDNGTDKIVLLCEYYERKSKRVKLVKLSSGEEMYMDDYQNRVKEIEEQGLPEVVPEIVDERWASKDIICMYRFIQDQVLEYRETSYSYLPYVWFICGLERTRKGDGAPIKEIVRPIVYNSKGIQGMKNMAGQSLVFAIQNLPQQKWKIPMEGIPKGQENMYTQNSMPNNILYHVYSPNNPDKPLPPPELVQGQAINQELSNTFLVSDKSMQSVMGIYDASLGINDNQLSGAAIEAGSMNSNISALPAVKDYMDSLNQVATIIVSLIPEIWVDSRDIVIKDLEGKKIIVPINQQVDTPRGQVEIKLDFDMNDFNIKVEAGASYALQQFRSIKTIVDLAKSLPPFAAFVQQMPQVLNIIADNITGLSGADQLKRLIDQYVKELEEAKEKAKSSPPPPNPDMIKAQTQQMDVMRQAQADKAKQQLDAAKIAISNKEADNNRLKAMADIHESVSSIELQKMRSDSEEARAATDMAIKYIDSRDKHLIPRR